MRQIRTEKLMQDLDAVMRDAEELAEANVQTPDQKIAAAPEQVTRSLRSVREKLTTAAHHKIQAAGDAAKDTNRYVHENPWTSLGLAAAAGIIVGLLMSRRSGKNAPRPLA